MKTLSKSTVFSENFGIIGLIRTNFAVSCIISYWWSQCDNVPMLDVQKYRVIIIKRKRRKNIFLAFHDANKMNNIFKAIFHTVLQPTNPRLTSF